MFISALELLKIGIGPSSSHTMGPMLAAKEFTHLIEKYLMTHDNTQEVSIRCTLKGSLSATGKGHATDRAIALGLHGYLPTDVAIMIWSPWLIVFGKINQLKLMIRIEFYSLRATTLFSIKARHFQSTLME